MAPPDDKNFTRALKAEDEQNAQMPDAVDRALRQKLRTPRAEPRRPWVFAVAAVAAVVLALVLWPRTPVEPDGWLCDGCTLEDAPRGVTVTAKGRAQTTGRRITQGVVEVSVLKVAAASDAIRFEVSHGTIEVRGTRFTVTQQTDGGQVVLHEGSIAFLAPDGRVVLVKPGETLRWPLAPVPPPPPAPRSPDPEPTPEPVAPKKIQKAAPVPAAVPVAPAPPLSADPLLAQLAPLRSRGDYAEAARLLEAALNDPYPPATREQLSFELGSILTHHVKSPVRACERWKQHQAAFPNGRYAAQIDGLRARLGCPAR